ncbi:hypothetical protein O5O45_31855 [Hahella aquimaris]|uniref:hypothetical protein n=1 Tax=Hahella sp. HNIBRBA332 TaxID=3015983 RepID=UPI00273B53FB|nr:hypothetical protein [Hahella sp. HNIBRBA332]WLQ14315.1 hypothetical protein O5O45_31855 [Hahella sp. HNIBRBA332]
MRIIVDSLKARAHLLRGRRITEDEVNRLSSELNYDNRLSGLIKIMTAFPLSHSCFSLSEDIDISNIGLDLKWLSPDQIIDEALNAYPGKLVYKLGYIPIGSCLAGSGDPYFLSPSDSLESSKLVRIPHDMASNCNSYPTDSIELVCTSLDDFFVNASFE